MEPDRFQWCPLTEEEAVSSGKPGTFHLNIQKHFFSLRVTKDWHRLPRETEEFSTPGKYSLTPIDTAHSPGQ